jgi:hypothetical protein
MDFENDYALPALLPAFSYCDRIYKMMNVAKFYKNGSKLGYLSNIGLVLGI